MDLSKARAIFFEESRELCDAFEAALLDREQFPANLETFNLLFRTAHTIKGSAGIFGLDALVRFAHVVENVLERLRSNHIPLDDALISLLLECNDHLRRLLDLVDLDESRAGEDLSEGIPLYSRLHHYQEGGKAASPIAPALPISTASTGLKVTTGLWQLSLRFYPDMYRDGFDPASLLRYLATMGTITCVEPVWRSLPPLQIIDATECFLGLEVSFDSEADPQMIHDAFEFVREFSQIKILPPHAPLQDYRAVADQLGGSVDEQIARWCKRGALTAQEAERVALGEFTQIEASDTHTKTDLAPPPATPGARSAAKPDSQYIRVEASKLDRLINRVGELVIAASGTTLLAQCRDDAELLESVAIINSLVENIRDDALTLRMVPVGEIFGRFPRMVREVSQQLGKTIQLKIEGAETEIDKSMVEKLNDPLMHIVRNAVDHGLESRQQRIAAGKPEAGTVTLNAYHDAGSVVVEVHDDGGGINTEKVLAKGIERGLVQEGRPISEQEIFQLLFHPGFSTADKVSDLSGRGVGMDVVKRNIEALRGEIEIQSRRGKGSTFRLRLPLTLAIIDGFRIEVNGSSLVMPLDMMIECVDMPPNAMHQHSRQIDVRGDWLPFVSLRELFGLPPATCQEFIVIVHFGENRAGIVVDKLIGEVQAVIKPLGEMFKSLRGISGSTILGNGKPALILDVPQLIQHALRRERKLIRKNTGTLILDQY